MFIDASQNKAWKCHITGSRCIIQQSIPLPPSNQSPLPDTLVPSLASVHPDLVQTSSNSAPLLDDGDLSYSRRNSLTFWETVLCNTISDLACSRPAIRSRISLLHGLTLLARNTVVHFGGSSPAVCAASLMMRQLSTVCWPARTKLVSNTEGGGRGY